MKKLFALLLAVILLLPAVALAEDDNEFMGLTYIQLMGKLGKVQRALWACEEWSSVDVYAGVYKIGEDIPAGHWTITPAADNDFYSIGYGSRLNISETGLDSDSIIEWMNISSDYSDARSHRLDIVLQEGYFLELGHKSTFRPYSGKTTPNFNFD